MPRPVGDPSISGSGSELLRRVDVASGNLNLMMTDLAIPARGPDLTIIRAYNSRSTQWTFNFEAKISFVPATYNRQLTIGPREDGRTDSWFKDMNGVWYSLNPGNFEQLEQLPNGTFVLYTQENLWYGFASPTGVEAGRLQKISDRDGNSINFTYNGSNQLATISDASSRSLTIARDAGGRVSSITDFGGRSVQYGYNSSSGMIVSARNMRGKQSNYSYAAGNNKLLTQATDPRGNAQLTVTYHAPSANITRVASVAHGAAHPWSFTYGTASGRAATLVTRPSVNGVDHNIGFIVDDARTQVLERFDSLTGVTKQRYKSAADRKRLADFGLIDESYAPSNAKTTIGYVDDRHGNPQAVTDALNRTTAMTWGSVAGQSNLTPMTSVSVPGVATPATFGNFTQAGKAQIATAPTGATRYASYTAAGLLSSTTDPRGATTQYAYTQNAADSNGQALGLPTRITNALNGVGGANGIVDIFYDKFGQVKSIKDTRNRVTTYTHDANGNVLTVTDSDGKVTTLAYDDSDNLISIRDPRNNTLHFEYDSLNRKIEEWYLVSGERRSRLFYYDALGRIERVTNEKGNQGTLRYDARGRVSSRVNPLLVTDVSYTYDSNGNVKTATDGAGRVVSYDYDTLDRLVRTTDALGNYEQYTYNTQGLVSQKRDPRGQTTHYRYDDMGRLTHVVDPDGPSDAGDSAANVTVASYDANGNLVQVRDRKNQITKYDYDLLNRVTKLTDAMNREWRFQYFDDGAIKSTTTPSNATTSYTYDNVGRVKTIAYPGGPNVTYSYDANGNRTQMVDGNGTTSYSYDEMNRLVSMNDAFGNLVGWRYDKAGYLDRLTYPGNRAVNYIVDAAGRLQSITDWLNHQTSYARDNSGFITQITYGNGASISRTADAAGRLVNLVNRKSGGGIISSHSLTLDGAGLPTSANLDLPLMPTNLGKNVAMLYDASNRLTSAGGATMVNDLDGRLVTDNSGSSAVAYVYNAQDLITSVSKAGAVTDTYLYDGDGHRVAHTRNGQTTRFVQDPTGGNMYRLLLETSASNTPQNYYIHGDGGLVSQINGSEHRYYHFDQTGNTIALTNNAGNVTDTYAYEPFGNTTSQGTSHNPFRFVGQFGVVDDGNGLQHMRARYYRPDLRRFVSLDALYGQVTDPMSLNRYQYVMGNPIIGIDPTGLSTSTMLDEDIERARESIKSAKNAQQKNLAFRHWKSLKHQKAQQAPLYDLVSSSELSQNSPLTGPGSSMPSSNPSGSLSAIPSKPSATVNVVATISTNVIVKTDYSSYMHSTLKVLDNVDKVTKGVDITLRTTKMYDYLLNSSDMNLEFTKHCESLNSGGPIMPYINCLQAQKEFQQNSFQGLPVTVSKPLLATLADIVSIATGAPVKDLCPECYK